MSYRRSFTKTIAVHFSGTEYATVSTAEGSKTVPVPYSGTVHEPVTVNVDVDTDPFDNSVRHCNGSVGTLTGSVVATETAQVQSIRRNSRKVGETIIQGFFSTVQSEISQQIMETSSRIEATLVHLREMAQRCVAKQKQMETDYGRLASRYCSIFEDLNKELENRIYELDRPTFKFKETSDKTANRGIGTDLASAVAISGAENGHLEAMLGVSITKKQAMNALGKANTFLVKQKTCERLLDSCSINESTDAVYYAPVCYIETKGESDVISNELYTSEFIGKQTNNRLAEKMKDITFTTDEFDQDMLKTHFSAEVADKYAYSDSHDERVRDYITKLFNNTLE
jgi:hypothetical protein